MMSRPTRFTQARATLLAVFALAATAGCTRQIADVPRLPQAKTAAAPSGKAPAPVEAAKPTQPAPAPKEIIPADTTAENQAGIREAAEELARIQRAEAEALAADKAASKPTPPPVAPGTPVTPPPPAAKPAPAPVAESEDDDDDDGDIVCKDCGVHDTEAKPAPAPAATTPPAQAIARDFETFVTGTYAKSGTRVVVQVNRAAAAPESASVDRDKLTRALTEAFAKSTRVLTTARLYGETYTGETKAIHLAFDKEARSLGLLPTRDLRQSPAIILTPRVAPAESGAQTLTVTAIESSTGKTVWTGTATL